jgi:hypothetical protein
VYICLSLCPYLRNFVPVRQNVQFDFFYKIFVSVEAPGLLILILIGPEVLEICVLNFVYFFSVTITSAKQHRFTGGRELYVLYHVQFIF